MTLEVEKTKFDNLLQKKLNQNLQNLEINIKEEKYITKS